ncbi:DNA-binding response OmpR family regulator [Prauserella shujinwangii]|uniref:DNA-binding response OmpR family regulator n=1 Tax=Prauserella shujinwangii TaxID=1453103 RepID=A0A2T0LTF8_9PSEU|nr:response regulator transcription factor [Prauserella shujinwangii]PRX46983.1 DNA-binding response OmpR family regulator [Prauserella shujinwangii]
MDLDRPTDRAAHPAPFAQTLLVGFGRHRGSWLERLLSRHGHGVCQATGWREIRDHRPHVDLVLVRMDGTAEGPDLCRLIRSHVDAALIAVSGENTERERLRAFEAGCDEHLYWWCGPVEIMARIDAVLRWARPRAHTPEILEHGPLRIDVATRQVWLAERDVHLTAKEFDLLRVLAGRSGSVVPRAEILATVWGESSGFAGRSLDTHVSSLRRKLGRWVCVTIKGQGLRMGEPDPPG